MHYAKYEGIVVNRRAVGDADSFLTIFTRDAGKLSVYAKSIRSTRSKRIGSLDLFSRIRFEVAERGGHRTLTHVELLDSYRNNKKALTNIGRLFELGELVDALVPEEDPHREVYELLSTALTHLSHFQTPEYVLRFKKKLLFLLGYGDRELSLSEIDAYIESLLSRPLRAPRVLTK